MFFHVIGGTTKFFPYTTCCTAWILGSLVMFLDRRQKICLHTFATKFLPWGILSFHKQFSLSCGQQESLSYICVHCTLQQVHWLQILHQIMWSKQWLKTKAVTVQTKDQVCFPSHSCPNVSLLFLREACRWFHHSSGSCGLDGMALTCSLLNWWSCLVGRSRTYLKDWLWLAGKTVGIVT